MGTSAGGMVGATSGTIYCAVSPKMNDKAVIETLGITVGTGAGAGAGAMVTAYGAKKGYKVIKNMVGRGREQPSQ